MATTSTTQIFVGSLLDLVGQPTPAPREDGDRTIFDALLQPPPVSPAREEPPRAEPLSESHSERDGTPNSPVNDQRAAENTGRPPANEANREEQPDEFSDDSAAELPDTENAENLNEVPEEGSLQESDGPQVAAEALAGLAAIVSFQAELPTAVPGEIAEGGEEEVVAIGDAGSLPIVRKPSRNELRGPATATTEQSAAIRAVQAIGAKGEPVAESQESQVAGQIALANAESIHQAEEASRVATEPIAEVKQQSGAILPAVAAEAKEPEALTGKAARRDERDSAAERQAPEKSSAATADPIQSPTAPETQKNGPQVAAIALPNAPAAAQPTSSANGPATGAITPPSSQSRSSSAALQSKPEGVSRRSGAPIDTSRLLHRVARAVATANSQDGEIRLRLSPPELGSLKLQVQILEGALSVRCEAETSAARTAILENLPALRERLADQGVRIERFDVDLMQRQGSGTPDRPNDQERPAPPPAPRTEPSRPRIAVPASERPTPAVVEGAGRLNVII